jgi:hypothetical protein
MDNPDLLQIVASYTGDEEYIGVATLSTLWKNVWGERPRKSRAIGHGVSPARLLLAFDTSLKKTEKLARRAVKIGRLDILNMCRDNGCPWDNWTFSAAAKGGDMEIVRYLKDNGCPWNEWACSQAARWGHLDVLKFLIDNGCPWDEWTPSDAARGGHLEILRYVKARGAEWDEHTMALAARGGKDESVTFLMREGCAWDKTAIDAAARGGHVEIFKSFTVKWFVRGGHSSQVQVEDIPLDVEDDPWDYSTMNSAAKGGHIEVLKLFKKRGIDWILEALCVAIEAGQLETVKFLVEDGCPHEEDDSEDAHTIAWNSDHTQIVEWLEENIEEYRGRSARYREEDERV